MRRGDFVESCHRVSVAVVDQKGNLVAAAGDPDLRTFWRSAAKPFQAMPLIEDGAASTFGLGDEELALTCASHSSEPRHREVTDRFLTKIGCVESHLACGPHLPLGPSMAAQVQRDGVTPTPLWSNCSGNHSGMLALAQHHGWPLHEYTDVEHPVQQRLLTSVAEWTQLSPDEIGLAVDGCTTICYLLPLRSMALAYARLGVDEGEAASALRRAMLTYPELVAGTERFDTKVMRALPGDVIVKVGAEGIYSASIIKQGLGIALKVEDGDAAVAPIALAGVLESLLGTDYPEGQLAEYTAVPICSTREAVVGETCAVGDLQTFDP